MKVYRVEHRETGNGPYAASKWRGRANWEFSNSLRHPTAPEDEPLWDQLWALGVRDRWGTEEIFSQYHFAFASMEQLREWFHDHDMLESLDESGYCVAVYEVRRMKGACLVGRAQAMFVKAWSRLVERVSILEVSHQ